MQNVGLFDLHLVKFFLLNNQTGRMVSVRVRIATTRLITHFLTLQLEFFMFVKVCLNVDVPFRYLLHKVLVFDKLRH